MRGTHTLVPACAQHSVLDPQENVELMRLLPMTAEPVSRYGEAQIT
jgi:hypothetical protein